MDDGVLEIDLDRLTINEVDDIEEILDCNIDDVFGPGMRRGKVLRAIGYVVKRRTDPDFTLEQAGELVIKLAADPTEASGA